METGKYPNSSVRTFYVGYLLSAVLFATSASAGIARYSAATDATQISHAKITYAAEGIRIAADFMASVNLPAATGDLIGGPGDFTYTWDLSSVSPQPSSNTMFCGPLLSINGKTYGWLYGSKNGVLCMRATGGHAKSEKAYGDPVTLSQMPSSICIQREGTVLNFKYTYSPMMPYITGDSVDLGENAAASVTYQVMWSSVTSVLSGITVTGNMIPDVNQEAAEGEGEVIEEGEAEEGEMEGEVVSGPGRAIYTDEQDEVKIDTEGVTYDGGEINFTGGPYITLPRKGGLLENIPAGDFTYTVYMAYVDPPTYPMGFAGISVVINGYDYLLLYRAGSASGLPLQVKASRGMMGGVTFGAADLEFAPTAMRIRRSENTLYWEYSTSGLADDFQSLASVNLADPLGDGSIDDSTGKSRFDLLAFLDMTVSHIEISGDPMYSVNKEIPSDPDKKVPALHVLGLALVAVMLNLLAIARFHRQSGMKEG